MSNGHSGLSCSLMYMVEEYHPVLFRLGRCPVVRLPSTQGRLGSARASPRGTAEPAQPRTAPCPHRMAPHDRLQPPRAGRGTCSPERRDWCPSTTDDS